MRWHAAVAYVLRAAEMNAFVIAGLVKCRAQIASDIEKAHEALRRMVVDLEKS